MASSTRLKVGTREIHWALQPRVYFHEQLQALLTSSHPRCGRNSPASVLPVSLIRQMADMWRPGTVFISSFTPRNVTPNVAVIVGLSKHTLGVTTRDPIITQPDVGDDVVWMTDDGSRFLRPAVLPSYGRQVPVPAAVCDFGIGCEVPIPKSGNLCAVECKGQWIIDNLRWRMWRVVVAPSPPADEQCGERRGSDCCEVDSKKGLLCVLGPRKLVPCKSHERTHNMLFNSFVGDGGFFNVCCYACNHNNQFIHLIDSARAFETGEIVPVDTVEILKPVKHSSIFQIFWGSRRMLATSCAFIYEMMGGGIPRELCSVKCQCVVTDTLFIAERRVGTNECCLWDFSGNSQEAKVFSLPPCVCTGLGAAGDFLIVAEGCTKAHVIEPASGLAIFTLQLL